MNRRFIIRMRPTTYHRAKRCGDTRERVCVEFVIIYNLYTTILIHKMGEKMERDYVIITKDADEQRIL